MGKLQRRPQQITQTPTFRSSKTTYFGYFPLMACNTSNYSYIYFRSAMDCAEAKQQIKGLWSDKICVAVKKTKGIMNQLPNL